MDLFKNEALEEDDVGTMVTSSKIEKDKICGV